MRTTLAVFGIIGFTSVALLMGALAPSSRGFHRADPSEM